MKKTVSAIVLVLMIAVTFLFTTFYIVKNPVEPMPENTGEVSNEPPQSESIKEPEPETTINTGANPAMWEVHAKQGNGHIYFLGSVHVGDESMFPLCQKVTDAYNESEFLAVECDMVAFSKDISAQLETVKKYICQRGSDIEDYLSEETYALMMNFLTENNVEGLSMYKNYRPAMWYSLMSNVFTTMSGFSSEQGIDQYFLKDAHKNNKKILEIESVSFQDDLFISQPDKLYDFMIRQSIKYSDIEVQNLKDIVYYYKTGSIEKIIEETEIEDSPEDYGITEEEYKNLEEMSDKYNKSLLNDRNVGMAETAIEYLESGKTVFYVVGLAHFIDEANIIDYMKNLGYEINRVN